MNTRKLGGGIDIYDLLHPSGGTKSQTKKNSKPQSNSKASAGRSNMSPQDSQIPPEYFSSYDSETNTNPGESSDNSTQSKIAHLTQLQSILATKNSIIEELEQKVEACRQEQKEMEANLFYKNSMNRKSLEGEMIALKNGIDEEDLGPEQLYSIIKTSDEMIMTLINENDQLTELFNQKVGLEVEIANRIDVLEQRLAEKEKLRQHRKKMPNVYEDFERRLGEIVAENETLMVGKKNLGEENKKLQEYVERLTKTAKDQAKLAAHARFEALYERMQQIESSNKSLEAEARAKTQNVEKLLLQINEMTQEVQGYSLQPQSRRESGVELNRSTQKTDKVAIIGINLSDSKGLRSETQNINCVIDEIPLSIDSALSSRRESLLNNKESNESKNSIPAPFSPVKRMNLIRKESNQAGLHPSRGSPTKHVQRENGQRPYLAYKEEEEIGCRDTYHQNISVGKKTQSSKLYLQEKVNYYADNAQKSNLSQIYGNNKTQFEFNDANSQNPGNNYQLPQQTGKNGQPIARLVDFGYVVSDHVGENAGGSTTRRDFYNPQEQAKRVTDNFYTSSNLLRNQGSAISIDYPQENYSSQQREEDDYYYSNDSQNTGMLSQASAQRQQKNSEADLYRAFPYNTPQHQMNSSRAHVRASNRNDFPAPTDALDSDRKIISIDLSDFQPPQHINI